MWSQDVKSRELTKGYLFKYMETNYCAGCIWEDACCGTEKCNDYTLEDDSADVLAYQQDLLGRILEYDNVIKELDDDFKGTVL